MDCVPCQIQRLESIKVGDTESNLSEEQENFLASVDFPNLARKRRSLRAWKDIEDALWLFDQRDRKFVHSEELKGGLIAMNLTGEAFLPGLKIDVKPHPGFRYLCGKKMKWTVGGQKSNPQSNRSSIVTKVLIWKESFGRKQKAWISTKPWERSSIWKGVTRTWPNFGVLHRILEV